MLHNDIFYLYTYHFDSSWNTVNHRRAHPFKFRVDPVPHTGGSRLCIHGGVRHMKTTQERRWALAHGKYVRGKRSFRMLPTNWDDYWHARREKGWKRTKYKKKQWQ